jgi:hypothetical protein
MHESPLRIVDNRVSPSRQSSVSTNKVGSSLWGAVNAPPSVVGNLNQSLPELDEEDDEPPKQTFPDEDAETVQQRLVVQSTTSALTSFQNLNFQREQYSKIAA